MYIFLAFRLSHIIIFQVNNLLLTTSIVISSSLGFRVRKNMIIIFLIILSQITLGQHFQHRPHLIRVIIIITLQHTLLTNPRPITLHQLFSFGLPHNNRLWLWGHHCRPTHWDMTAITLIHMVVLTEVAFIKIVGIVLFVGLGEVEVVVVLDDVLGLLNAVA